jgi:hypothetical protein
MFLLLVTFVCIGSYLVGAVWLCKSVGRKLVRAFLYDVAAFCLSVYEVLVCHFASSLLDAYCSSVFVVVEGVALKNNPQPPSLDSC